MKDRNKVQLIGWVGADPSIKKFGNGSKCARIRVATNTPLKNKAEGGVQQYNTLWHTVVAWAKSADFTEQNFLKGSHILVEGHLVYRTYHDKDGLVKSVTEIMAVTLCNLDR
jgi:single-strand DNA-binding protein